MCKRRRCKNSQCGKMFVPKPHVPHQEYCSAAECQKVRKREWQREKLARDADYRKAQQEAQAKWCCNNPDYWKKYRRQNTDYTERNRSRQREKMRLMQRQDHVDEFAKMDVLNQRNDQFTGRYILTPVRNGRFAKMDALIVKIIEVSKGYADIGDVCKERT